MSVKLTAEQVREAIFNGSAYASYDGAMYYANGISMQTIADELNAALDNGECKMVYGENDHGDDGWWCQSCGEWFAASFRHTGQNNIIKPRYCQHCGKAMKHE